MNLTSEQIQMITDRAYDRWRVYKRGIRGQTPMPQDDIEYWAVVETVKFIQEPCQSCKGTGAQTYPNATTTRLHPCAACSGSGKQHFNHYER